MAVGPGSSNSGGGSGGLGSDPQLLDSSRNYPHPFFGISDKYIPNTMKEMFRWAMYVYSTNGSVNQTIRKMAGYVTTQMSGTLVWRPHRTMYVRTVPRTCQQLPHAACSCLLTST